MENTPNDNSKPMPAPFGDLKPEQRLEVLNKHPLFTGRCFNCKKPVSPEDALESDWQCPKCAWNTSELPGSGLV